MYYQKLGMYDHKMVQGCQAKLDRVSHHAPNATRLRILLSRILIGDLGFFNSSHHTFQGSTPSITLFTTYTHLLHAT